jgi:hypothetical protein
MHLTARRKIGLVILGAAALAAVIIQLLTGQVVQALTLPDAQPAQSGGQVLDMVGGVVITLRYTLPLAGCCLIGVTVFAWPARKPPRLAS